MQIKKAFLIGAFVAVTIIALLYAVSPTWFAATLLGVTDLNLNFAHILRAIGGLYLALAAFWLYAAFNDKYRDAALLTTILFAGGLACKLDPRWSTRTGAIDLFGDGVRGCSGRVLGLQASRAMTDRVFVSSRAQCRSAPSITQGERGGCESDGRGAAPCKSGPEP